ncbi:Os02g0795100 [Oryza sativa Japonica Group]|uniref:Os02g0795100 protein n=2 Tax=Oryza sativa subsp. japonica TaxID=39947 RepID=Q0DWU2_ORYSJ|nr:hypothetical protein EE612_014212 [Oryza sativa]BAF10296.1 Os02g0795100 [Oryza sativa Japonica Group]BAS81353.1 Os02g0795100 [Oryza sativa Japonica Group]|eukprot:NP_001048382.1 Os02g0795100 [Oryza sativa Japonica Group]
MRLAPSPRLAGDTSSAAFFPAHDGQPNQSNQTTPSDHSLSPWTRTERAPRRLAINRLAAHHLRRRSLRLNLNLHVLGGGVLLGGRAAGAVSGEAKATPEAAAAATPMEDARQQRPRRGDLACGSGSHRGLREERTDGGGRRRRRRRGRDARRRVSLHRHGRRELDREGELRFTRNIAKVLEVFAPEFDGGVSCRRA